LSVYPNPAPSLINVVFEAKDADYTIAVLDLQGRTVLANQHANLTGLQTVEIPVSELKSGNYLISVSTGGAAIQKMITIK